MAKVSQVGKAVTVIDSTKSQPRGGGRGVLAPFSSVDLGIKHCESCQLELSPMTCSVMGSSAVTLIGLQQSFSDPFCLELGQHEDPPN